MPRRSSGEGSIARRKDGRWQAAIQIASRRVTVYGKTRSEVVEKLRGLAEGAARAGGRLPTGGKLTLGAYLGEWLEQAQTRLRPTTLSDYRIICDKHISPRIGALPLTRLTALHIARLYTELAQAGLSPRRRQMVHGFLHKTLGDALRWGLLTANPAALVDAPKRAHKERKLWSPEQVAVFLAAMQAGEGGQYSYLFGFLLASGCRIGEALGLRWGDVDWQKGTVRIERQITEVHSRPFEGEPKTRAGRRTIALPAWALEMLRGQKARVAEMRLQAGAVWQESNRVFPTRVGSVALQGNVRRALREACDRLGLPGLRVHDLRHLHLSLLAMNGVPLKVAQARAGHSSPQVTLQVYQHVLGDADRAAAEAIGKALAAR